MNRTRTRRRQLAHARNLKRRSDKLFLTQVAQKKWGSLPVVEDLLRMPGTYVSHDRSGVVIPEEVPTQVRKSRLPLTERPSRAGSIHATEPRTELPARDVWAQETSNGKFHTAIQVRKTDGETSYYPSPSCGISKRMNFHKFDVVGKDDVLPNEFCSRCKKG